MLLLRGLSDDVGGERRLVIMPSLVPVKVSLPGRRVFYGPAWAVYQQHYAVGRQPVRRWPTAKFRFPEHALGMFSRHVLKPHMQYLLSDIAPYCLQTLQHTCHVNQIPSLITHFSRDNTAPSLARFVQDGESVFRTIARSEWGTKWAVSVLPTRSIV